VEGGAPEGEPKDLPKPPVLTPASAQPAVPRQAIQGGDVKRTRALKVTGIQPERVAANVSFQVTAELPDGSIQPLLWLQPFKPAYNHALWVRNHLTLPRGTLIRGVEPGSTIDLLPAH